jgi:hypothetical protein
MAEAMKAEQYSNWINKDITIDDELRSYYEMFLVGTPAWGLSRKGRDLYDYYQYRTVDEYAVLFAQLVERISDIGFYESYPDLGEALLKHKWLGFIEQPTDVTEAIHIYIGKYQDDELYKNHFMDLPAVENKGPNDERHEATEKKRKIAYTNQIFRHLRNSLAHGQVAVLTCEKGKFYIFQDENGKHNISARIIIQRSTLEKWITILHDRKDKISSKK